MNFLRDKKGLFGGHKKRRFFSLRGAVLTTDITYTDASIETIVHLMQHAESEQTRLVAAVALLDRAYGKPKPKEDEEPPKEQTRIIVSFVGSDEKGGWVSPDDGKLVAYDPKSKNV